MNKLVLAYLKLGFPDDIGHVKTFQFANDTRFVNS